jgi:putative heme transporter
VSRFRRHGKRVLGTGAALAVIALVFLVLLPRIASYRDVLDVLGRLTWLDGLALLVAVVINVATFAPPWMAALPGLGFGHALVVTQAATAASSVVPGGEAVGIGVSVGMLRKWAFRREDVALATILVTVFNVFAKISFPILAVGLLAVEGGTEDTLSLLAPIAFAVLVVLVGMVVASLWSERQAERLGGLAGRIAARLLRLARRERRVEWGTSVVRFRGRAIALLKRRGIALTVATAVGHLSTFALLLVILRALGVSSDEIDAVEAFAAWSLVRLLTVIPITPGGLGIIELGLSGALVAFGGANADVVAAVLLYRLLTWLPTLAVGLPSAFVWRRLNPAEYAQERDAASEAIAASEEGSA